MLASVIIRTLNESRYLGELLAAIKNQKLTDIQCEIVVVDSGSTDSTVDIARNYGCQLTYISKDDFTFGRSLNQGCETAKGDFLIFISGHCIPENEFWLENLIKPLRTNDIAYSYGRQVGRDNTKFSERCLFAKYFPAESRIPQEGFYCNNANAALRRDVWEKYRFNEDLTGLEDMHLAKTLALDSYRTAYISEACVYHIHDETWKQVKTRYEREAYALQQIMPEIQLSVFDVISYTLAGIWEDSWVARKEGRLFSLLPEICAFRLMQYWGAYAGNHEHRVLSKQRKVRYFYPVNKENPESGKKENHRLAADESE